MKLAGRELKRFIRKELTRQLLEQSDAEVELSSDAKAKAAEVGKNIEQNNSETMSSVNSYMETTPGIDHSSLEAALAKLQQAQTEVDAVVSSLSVNESDQDSEVIEAIRKVGDEYAVYPKDGGKRLGTHSSKKAAKRQLAAIEISKKG